MSGIKLLVLLSPVAVYVSVVLLARDPLGIEAAVALAWLATVDWVAGLGVGLLAPWLERRIR